MTSLSQPLAEITQAMALADISPEEYRALRIRHYGEPVEELLPNSKATAIQTPLEYDSYHTVIREFLGNPIADKVSVATGRVYDDESGRFKLTWKKWKIYNAKPLLETGACTPCEMAETMQYYAELAQQSRMHIGGMELTFAKRPGRHANENRYRINFIQHIGPKGARIVGKEIFVNSGVFSQAGFEDNGQYERVCGIWRPVNTAQSADLDVALSDSEAAAAHYV